MADDKPLLQDRKLLYVAPLVIAVIAAAIIVVTLVYQPPQPVVVAPPAHEVQVTKLAPIIAPVSEPLPLTRADLINGARSAADDFAATGETPPGPDLLVGRRFSIRIAFGCGGVQGGDRRSQATVTYNADNQSVTLTATPGVWTTLPLMQGLENSADLDAVEGFWIPRPWTQSKSCPAQTDFPVPPTPTPPTAQTLGLAQIFEKGGSRVLQHADHPYAFTRKLVSDDPSMLNHSYRLVLEGRIAGYSDGRALRCWMEAPDHQPLCIYAVVFDHVAFEDGVTGEILANWND